MSKYNSKKEKGTGKVTNFMGETAYKYDPREDLISTVMTTFMTDKYYESETEIANRIKKNVELVDPLFTAKLAIYARTKGNMRSSSHYLTALLAEKISGKEWAKRFYRKVVNRPDDMSEILACYALLKGDTPKKVRKIHNAIRKGFREYLANMDAFQIANYKMESKDISLIDLVRLFRPKPSKFNKKAFNALMEGDNKTLNSLAGGKKLLSTMSAKPGEKAEALKEVLTQDKGAGYMELLRNLRNILLSAPDQVPTAINQLLIKEKVLKSRQLPFRFATAYSEIEKVNFSDLEVKAGSSSSIQFESDKPRITRDGFYSIKSELLNAIESALEISCMNIPNLEGKTAILIDHSGSVRGDAGGSSKVSAFSKVTTAMIGNLFGSIMATKSNDVYIGLFGDRLINVPIERDSNGKLKGGLLNFNKKSYDLGAKCGGSTEAGIYEFFRTAIEDKLHIDNVIVFSDCQIGEGGKTSWYGHTSSEHSGGFMDLFKRFKALNPMMNFVEVNINSTGGNSVFNPKDRILNISGWSDKIFDVIGSNLKGFKAMIKEIEKIEI